MVYALDAAPAMAVPPPMTNRAPIMLFNPVAEAVAKHPRPSIAHPIIHGRLRPYTSTMRPAGKFSNARANAGTATIVPTEDSARPTLVA
jgi:hypothetical protein